MKKRISTIKNIKSKKCDIFDHPFSSDITYHFDFQNIEKYSKKFNLNFYGPINQKFYILTELMKE